jgi:hypothetical protein
MNAARAPQVFLGGTCGASTRRTPIAIPILDAAGITFHDPQVAIGEWTQEHERRDQAAKEAADVLCLC